MTEYDYKKNIIEIRKFMHKYVEEFLRNEIRCSFRDYINKKKLRKFKWQLMLGMSKFYSDNLKLKINYKKKITIIFIEIISTVDRKDIRNLLFNFNIR